MSSPVQIIPVDNSPNQSWQVSITVNGQAVNLQVTLRYNEIAKYWVATIADQSGNVILDSIPLVTGVAPSGSGLNAIQNLLNQFYYLNVGSVAVFNASGTAQDFPDRDTLGTDFILLWGDSPAAL